MKMSDVVHRLETALSQHARAFEQVVCREVRFRLYTSSAQQELGIRITVDDHWQYERRLPTAPLVGMDYGSGEISYLIKSELRHAFSTLLERMMEDALSPNVPRMRPRRPVTPRGDWLDEDEAPSPAPEPAAISQPVLPPDETADELRGLYAD